MAAPVTLEAAARVRTGRLALDVDLTADVGETVVVLGPNGAGKTTLLRAIAGLVALDDGRIVVDGEALDDPVARTWVPTEARGIGFVFQDHLLFPHLTALENVAFGLRAQGGGRRTARRDAAEWLERVQLSDHADHRPSGLSGGQAQRVALARALALRPRVLLLDEPLAALDVTARVEVRRTLRTQLEMFEGARVLVTHDPVEAIALGDRVVVIEEGRVQQSGTISELRARPRSRYVADVVGVNLYSGTVAGDRLQTRTGTEIAVANDAGVTGDAFAIVHPEAVALYRTRPDGSPRNTWPGTVRDVDQTGRRARVRVDGPEPVTAEITEQALADLELARGTEVWVSVKATEVEVFPA